MDAFWHHHRLDITAAFTLAQRQTLSPPSLYRAATVELIVGEEHARFIVHKDLLCNAAEFLKQYLPVGL